MHGEVGIRYSISGKDTGDSRAAGRGFEYDLKTNTQEGLTI